MAVLAAAMLMFALVGCGDNGDPASPGGGDPLTATYIGYAGPNLCTLVITENTARYAAQVGDGYVLTVNLYNSKGTVSDVDGDELTLKPSNSETTFTVVVSGTYLAELNGTITYENSITDVGPGALSELNPVVSITTATLPNGTVGTAYSQTLTATSITPVSWLLDSGDLPGGLTLNATTGAITGTPTSANTFNFTVRATNAVSFDTKQLSIVITGGSVGNDWTWTGATVPANFDHEYNEEINRIAWGGGKFVALGDNSSHIAWANDTDLDNWTGHTIDSPAISRSARDLAYGNGYFVTVGGSNTYQAAISLVAYASDTNTNSWTTVSSLPFGEGNNYAEFHGVVHGSDKFVAVGYATAIMYANDNAPGTWALAKDLDLTKLDMLFCVAYGDGKWVTGGSYTDMTTFENGGLILWADDNDMDTWHRVQIPALQARSIRSIAFGEGKFIIGAQAKMYYADISDLDSWTEIPDSVHGFDDYWINDIAFGDGIFVAAGDDAKYAYTEPGNITTIWTKKTIAPFITGSGFLAEEDDIQSIAYGNGKWVAGSNTTKLAYTR